MSQRKHGLRQEIWPVQLHGDITVRARDHHDSLGPEKGSQNCPVRSPGHSRSHLPIT